MAESGFRPSSRLSTRRSTSTPCGPQMASAIRAEPAAALFFEQDGFPTTAHLVGVHPELEDELTNYTGRPGELSPDRLDSMVWLIWKLLLENPPGKTSTLDEHMGDTITGDLLEIRGSQVGSPPACPLPKAPTDEIGNGFVGVAPWSSDL